jgi:VanZ family protein
MIVKPLIFACCIVIIAALAIIPQSELPDALDFWDKAQHMLAFSVLAITGSLAFPKKLKTIYVGLISYGACIEVVQKYFTATHTGSLRDLLADCLGIALGIVIHFIISRFAKQEEI